MIGRFARMLGFLAAGFVVGVLTGMLVMCALPVCGEGCADERAIRFLWVFGSNVTGFLILAALPLKTRHVLVRILLLSTCSLAASIVYFLWQY
ncbi:MAG: hypothetical protein Q7T70_14740 [Polaromonas sp.]|nr:hypothetical protein [Polaromonas sp.]